MSASDADLNEAAATALTGKRWAIVQAVQHVPAGPGLYAIYGDDEAWRDLGLFAKQAAPLYVGKAEDSLVSRDLKGHFAAGARTIARTGSSTVRRSFAALLRETLDLRAVPRNRDNPGHFTNYGLTTSDDEQLTRWMHARLSIAVWPAPVGLEVPLADIETAMIRRFVPPMNLAKNPGKLARLSQARRVMASEAANWRPEN
jgi:hypothetical protein